MRQSIAEKRNRRGAALIIVLVLIVMLSLGAYTFTDLMVAQQRGAVTMGRRAQAQAAVASGVEYLKDYLAMLPEDQVAVGGHWDNPDYFRDITVAEGNDGVVRFAIVSALYDDYGEPSGLRFGAEDTSTQLNINVWASGQAGKVSAGSGGSGGLTGGGSSDEDLGGDTSEEDRGSDDSGAGGGEPTDDGGATLGDMIGGDLGEPTDSNSPTDADSEADSQDEGTASNPRDALMALPGMTEDIADAMLDWIDEDDEPREFGAEADSYTALGYEPRNGPIDSLDELLLVRGVTPELLFGADRNHNGMIDANEGDMAASLNGGLGSMSRGWATYLTVVSNELPPQSETEPVDLNQEDLEALFDAVVDAGFDEDVATYIVAYRQSGPYTLPEPTSDEEDGQNQSGQAAEPPKIESVDGRTVDLSAEGSQQFQSVLDLIGSLTQAKFNESENNSSSDGDGEQQSGETATTIVQSPFGEDGDLATVLPELMASFSAGEVAPGRLNVNSCAQPTMMGIPSMTESLAQSLLGQRDSAGLSGDPNYQYGTWPLALGLTTVDEMKALWPYVTGRGGVFRAQVVGYSDAPGAFARAEVTIDASDGTPKVVSWRDLTHLGPGEILDILMSP